MNPSVIIYIHNCFGKLTDEYGFSICKEINEDRYFMIEYKSSEFGLRLESYHREIYATVFKTGEEEERIAFFNLLEYLLQGKSAIPQSEFFRKEKDLDACYIKQIEHISTAFFNSYEIIVAFFFNKNYGTRRADVKEYFIKKYPELNKQVD